MACPTTEEYKEALENKKYLDDVIRREYKHRDSLINELCTSQKLLDGYKESLDYQKEVINKYEIYQEILKR
jgi:hypothetical protein